MDILIYVLYICRMHTCKTLHTYIHFTYIHCNTYSTYIVWQLELYLHRTNAYFFDLTDVKDKAEIEKLKAELAALRKKASEEDSRRLREENEKAALEIEAVAKSHQETETLKVCMYVWSIFIYNAYSTAYIHILILVFYIIFVCMYVRMFIYE